MGAAFAATGFLVGAPALTFDEETALFGTAADCGTLFEASSCVTVTSAWQPGHLIRLPSISIFAFRRLPQVHATETMLAGAAVCGADSFCGIGTTAPQEEHLIFLPANSSFAARRFPHLHATEIAIVA